MAKKRFNISSTLKKNTAEAAPQLAKKIPLKKKEKDLEEVKEKVEEIHNEPKAKIKETEAKIETPIIKETPKVPTQTISRAASKAKPKPVPEKVKLVRMTIDTPDQMHKQLKVKSVMAGISMRNYILKLIEKDLKKGGY